MQQFQYVRYKNQKERLIDFLCRRFPYHDELGWQSAIDRGTLVVDGMPSKGSMILETGQVIGYQRDVRDEPEIDRNYRILFEDQDIIVVEKSGNIPVVESGKYYKNTLLEVLKDQEGYPILHQVHRLDRETSGVLVIARSPRSAAQLGEQFAAGSPKKRYQAVLIGHLKESVFVDQPIRKVRPQGPSAVRIRQTIDPSGKASQTSFSPLQTSQDLTLVDVELWTGRTHQIRVHAEYLGCPVLGDKLYGQTDEQFVALLKQESQPIFGKFGLIDRQLLHASRLEFQHPSTAESLVFESSCRPFFTQYPCTQPLFSTD